MLFCYIRNGNTTRNTKSTAHIFLSHSLLFCHVRNGNTTRYTKSTAHIFLSHSLLFCHVRNGNTTRYTKSTAHIFLHIVYYSVTFVTPVLHVTQKVQFLYFCYIPVVYYSVTFVTSILRCTKSTVHIFLSYSILFCHVRTVKIIRHIKSLNKLQTKNILYIMCIPTFTTEHRTCVMLTIHMLTECFQSVSDHPAIINVFSTCKSILIVILTNLNAGKCTNE